MEKSSIKCKHGSFWQRAKKFFSHKLTLMLIPHADLRSLKMEFSISFAFSLLVFWTGLTSWATWSVVTNIDYWQMKVNHQILKLKVEYFAGELKKSRSVLAQVQEVDEQLRQLVGMKSRKAIIEGVQPGQGGPEKHDRSLLAKTLGHKLWKISDEEIRVESDIVYKESVQRLESFKEISEYIARERGLYRSIPWGWPVEGRVTSGFGERVSPTHGGPQFHTGIDLANEKGTPVYATADGVVRLAGWEGGYGRLVIISHGFGFSTYYGHNSEIVVKPGQQVRRGQLISYMGSSGSSTGNHVHYEVWLDGRYVNPWRFMTAESVESLRLAYLK